ncbi:MAG: hypothetical protein ACQEQH_03465 [Bacillota bacterium]
MKKVFQVILGFFLLIVLIVVGVVMYINLEVFNSAQAFNTYLYNNYSNVYNYQNTNDLLNLDSFNAVKEIKEVDIDGKRVITAYYETNSLKELKREIDDYMERNAGHVKTKSYEINIPFYGGLWAQTSKGITNLVWALDNKAILIKGNSRDSVETLKYDIKSYLDK